MILKKILPFLFSAAVLTACHSEQKNEMATLSGKTMGTTYTVKYIVPQNNKLPNSAQVQQELDSLLKEVNRQMSTYQNNSEISQFNQRKASQGEMPIADDFAAVVAESIRLNKVTEGALDVTVGPFVNLWGFGPDKTIRQAPTQEQLNAARNLVGLDKLIFKQPESGKKAQLGKTIDGVYLDLSAIAKGFGVDKLADYFEQHHVENYLVEIGGELRGKGKNLQGETWRVGIEQPNIAQNQNSQVVVSLHNKALATSGDYRNFHMDDKGNRLSHIINPKTEQPISHNLASISVVADTTMTADGLATGLYVLGEKEALRLAEQQNLAIFLIIKTEDGFETRMSSAFKSLIN
ncbi:FAD:protein FMN transferase [Kingella negevensis]|uniref:FAD:protein FMN transferase n=1 Tax=Kingella negevensis TaxID=1522312 RepID=UPI00050A32DE|nr:FAD:protein FMN transferase [Kingella negevensis]MDK4687894.1 FAD:protein FMN transferase [Kingella negevensis]WII91114.1 FAD:protein FMN transferase [Kingella negevensis]